MIRVFLGHDHCEEIAWHVAASSILRYASRPVSIIPVSLRALSGVLTRERDPNQSNEFSFSRFLTPWMSYYSGWSIFMDCDIVVREDICNLFQLRDDRFAVQVCQHDYVPKDAVKYLGNKQLAYPCKNWSSVMLFNNTKCRALTPDYVSHASGLELHQFKWLGDGEIGELPLKWNWLVGEYEPNPDAAAYHYTVGGPWFEEYADSDHADIWREERDYALHCAQKER